MEVVTKRADAMEACREKMGSMMRGEPEGPCCPMASMGRSMAKRGGGTLLLLPGLLLVGVGVAVLLWPGVLPWLLGGTSIVIGLFAFLMALQMRGFLRKLAVDVSEEPAAEPTTE